jgi:hypothetical protein
MELLHDALQALTVLRGQAGVQGHVRRVQVPRARELSPQRCKDLQVLRRVTRQVGRQVSSACCAALRARNTPSMSRHTQPKLGRSLTRPEQGRASLRRPGLAKSTRFVLRCLTML